MWGGEGEIHKPVELDMSKLYTVLEKRVLIWPLNSNYLESTIFTDIKVRAASRWISWFSFNIYREHFNILLVREKILTTTWIMIILRSYNIGQQRTKVKLAFHQIAPPPSFISKNWRKKFYAEIFISLSIFNLLNFKFEK